jgi:hypothetical protein
MKAFVSFAGTFSLMLIPLCAFAQDMGVMAPSEEASQGMGAPMAMPSSENSLDGVLTVKEKHGRQGRNPRTGEALVIEPHRVVRFRASELLLARLNRPISRRPEHPKSDPRQLAFPINDDQEKLGNMEIGPMLPRLARGRTRGREGAIYEKGE